MCAACCADAVSNNDTHVSAHTSPYGPDLWGGTPSGFRIPPPPPLSAAGFLRHLKHGVFATWLYMVSQIPTEMAKIPTRMAKFLSR